MLQSNYSRLMPSFVAQQLQTQRQNLSSVCRLAVKSLVDRSCSGIIDDGCKELENFVNVLEHIFSHRLKPYSTWYGGLEPRCFWDFIKVACRRVPHNCLSSVEALEIPQTPHGKGRAWIRMCLMEKRLADYVSVATQYTKLAENFYEEGSLMLSDDVHMLADLLVGLNCIDFSFDVKGVFLDYCAVPAIDFTPYLKFSQGLDNSYPPITTAGESGDITGDQLGVEFWKSKYNKLEAQYKISNEQKNYVEEMLRLRETQLAEANSQRQRLIEALQYLEKERKDDREQFESVIMELQSQLLQMKDENKLLMHKLHFTCRQREPVISMSQLIESEARTSNSDVFPESPRPTSQSHNDKSASGSEVTTAAAAARVRIVESELSIASDQLMGDVSPGDGRSNLEETGSTMALAGSFSSALATSATGSGNGNVSDPGNGNVTDPGNGNVTEPAEDEMHE